MAIYIEAVDQCVLVNAAPLQPNKFYPLKHLDYIELLDAMSNKRWRFQYSVAQLFYDHLNKVSYDLVRKLGQGGQGSVFECSSRSSLERVAVKVVRKPAVKTKQPKPAMPVDIPREVRMLKKLWEARSIQTYLDAFAFPKRLPQLPAAPTPIPIIPISAAVTFS